MAAAPCDAAGNDPGVRWWRVTGEVLLAAAGAIAALMLVTWVASLILRDASIVDPVWPLGFVIVAFVVRGIADGDPTRGWLLVALTTIWGVRLCIHLAARKHGEPEDFRYQAMRRHYGAQFGLISLVTVFALQGALMWVVSLPVQVGQVPDDPGVGVLAIAGVALWLVGFLFETIGDAQLTRFKADPASAGEVLDRGLWRYTRHPNYFGDACVWWGIALVAAESGARCDRPRRSARDDGAAPPRVGRPDARAHDGEATAGIRRLRAPHQPVPAAPTAARLTGPGSQWPHQAVGAARVPGAGEPGHREGHRARGQAGAGDELVGGRRFAGQRPRHRALLGRRPAQRRPRLVTGDGARPG